MKKEEKARKNNFLVNFLHNGAKMFGDNEFENSPERRKTKSPKKRSAKKGGFNEDDFDITKPMAMLRTRPT